MNPVLVLGIGNILLGDEGIGVRVIEAMQDLELPPHVDLADGGTGGANLIELIARRDRLIVVDAMDAGLPPGSIRRLTPDQLAPADGTCLSLHELGLLDTLRMARQLQCEPLQVVVIGVQPAMIEPGLQLSPALSNAIPDIIAAVVKELETA